MTTMANRMFGMVLLVALLYIITMYMLTSNHNLPWGSHDDDTHTDLQVTDEIIIILGYKLHPDGMATRILRDRVEKAANLYKELMGNGHHPLIIVSGKGKSDLGYTEAEVMMEWCSFFGVRTGDILVDPESTNTAQNAKFSAELIRNRTGIHQVYVVTSDYHILRAQYIFNSVFPVTVKMDFASSKSPANKLEDTMKKERALMQSSKEDLINENLLDRDDNGPHPASTFPLWQMISRELENDVFDGVTEYDDETLTVADYTNSQNYFVSQLAGKFPRSRVFVIDDRSTLGANVQPGQLLTNIYNCPTTTNATTFTHAQQLGVVYTYQLCFEMFHWIPTNASREEFENILASLLSNARTTFIEMPEAMVYKGREGQQNWELLNRWYAERNETYLLTEIARTHNMQLQYKILGPTIHDYNNVHKILRVDVIGNTPHFVKTDFTTVYKCP